MKRILVIAALLLTQFIAADGMFAGPHFQEVKPTIPYQRAIVAFKNDEETMVVESVLNAPAGRYSWIVPLPAAPSLIEKADGETVESLTRAMAPRIDSGGGWPFRAVYTIFGLILCAIISAPVRYKRQSYGGPARLAVEVLAVCALGISLYFVMPGFFQGHSGLKFAGESAGGSSLGAAPAVEVLRRALIGNYEVEVVKGNSPQPLLDWLAKNGTPLPSDAQSVVQDYITKGWVFMGAKLASHSGGMMRPHPLKVTFPVKEAVYPMKLTGHATPKLALDLVVIGNQLGSFDGGDLICSTIPQVRRYDNYYRPSDPPRISYGIFGDALGTPLMWDGCCVSRTRATLTPADMGRDFAITWSAPREYRARLFSDDGAGAISMAYGFIAVAGVAFVCTAFWLKRPNFGELASLTSLLAGLIAGVIVWFASYHLIKHVSTDDGTYVVMKPPPIERRFTV